MRAAADLVPRALVGLLLLLGALAYRRLLFWDPSAPGIPGTGWFFFRASETAPQILFALLLPLLYRRRKRIARALRARPAPGLALPLLALGAALHLWGHYADALDLVLASLLAVTFGSAFLLSGPRLARELTLPLVFLAFAIPLPAVVTNQLMFPLQLSTAVHTEWLLHAIGIPAVREGDMIYRPGEAFQIIETCSGLRSIFVLTTLAVGWLCFFPARRLVAALLIASAPLIAYLLNTVRVLSLVLHPQSELASLHALQGLAVFLAGLLILYGVDELLRRMAGASGANAAQREHASAPVGSPDPKRQWRAIALALLLGATVGASLWIPPWSQPASARRPKIELPQAIDGWNLIRELEPQRLFLGSVAFRRHAYGEYGREGETVSVFIGYDDRLSRNRSLISAKNALPGAGWHVEERARIEVAPGLRRVESVAARSGAGRILSYHWYEGTNSLATEFLRAWLAADQSFLRRPGGAWVVRLSTPILPVREGKARAEARLRDLAALLGPRVRGWAAAN